jgi:hypothetical protein
MPNAFKRKRTTLPPRSKSRIGSEMLDELERPRRKLLLLPPPPRSKSGSKLSHRLLPTSSIGFAKPNMFERPRINLLLLPLPPPPRIKSGSKRFGFLPNIETCASQAQACQSCLQLTPSCCSQAIEPKEIDFDEGHFV